MNANCRKILQFVLIACVLAACSARQSDEPSMPMTYPETASVDHVDVYHGEEVADPYRWLEDDVRENDSVAAWVAAQNELTSAYLARIDERQAIEERLTALWDFERFGLPTKAGGRYFYAYNDGLQNQEVIYVLDSPDGEPRLLIDPNAWSDDGTIALAEYFPSPDGKHLAYLVQDGGSDWRRFSKWIPGGCSPTVSPGSNLRIWSGLATGRAFTTAVILRCPRKTSFSL